VSTVDYGRGLRPLWAFDEAMTFFNHGAFGATPRELMAEQDRWRARMERQTARFFMGELPDLIREAAGALAAFVGAAPERLVMVENASQGIQAVLNALVLEPGDRILATDHVYGAVRHAATHVARRAGAELVEVKVPLPVAGPGAFGAALEAALDGRTRLLIVDHVTSPSALVLPVARLVALARSRGVPVLVDGAHGPGLLDLDVGAVGADWYVGNCHKWLCAPKGAGFLVLGPEAPGDLHPVTISHAYGRGPVAEFGKIGTRDPSAWLSVPAAIAFHRRLGGAALRARNRALALEGARYLETRLGLVPAGPDEMLSAMVALRLPGGFGAATPERAAELREALWQAARIEAIVMVHSGALWLRLCAHAYSEAGEFARLAEVLDALGRGAAP
jgi:isopenicillin-N epimerase